jgi:hypothetical protein
MNSGNEVKGPLGCFMMLLGFVVYFGGLVAMVATG